MFQKGKRVKQGLSAICAAALLVGSLGGCKSSTSSTSGTSGSSGASAHIDFSILNSNYLDTSGVMSGEVLKELEKQSNSTINIQWAPGASYTDKFNVLMASNSLPDAVLVPDLKSSVFTNAANGNQFWCLDSYLSSSEFKNFKNFSKTALTNTKTNGKSYVLPRERILKRAMIVYRADWAKKAGLGAPDTLDKLYNMAKTFANGDFDGDGKKDTIGFCAGTYSDGGGSTIDGFPCLNVANGGFYNWGLKNGKVTSMYDTNEYQSTMDFYKKMYSDGLMSSDFTITKSSAIALDYVDKEKTGLWSSMTLPGLSDSLLLSKQKADPSIKRSDIYGYCFMKDSKGNPRIPSESGFNGGIAFSKTSVKTEARLKQILGVFNFIASKEGMTLINDGIEGREYKLNSDGSATITDSNLVKTEVGDINQFGIALTKYPMAYADDEDKQLDKDRNTYKSSDLVGDVSIPLASDTWSNSSASLYKIIDTAQFKYIMGQENLAQFKNDIKTWKSSGGDKVASEFTASYNKNNKKGASSK